MNGIGDIRSLKCLMILAIIHTHTHTTYGGILTRSTSSPNLRLLYNETSYNKNTIISSNEYKNNIYNRYKRNPYLRSKEKYSFDNK
uniref:Uncharacterized protein n=1 Tax=viral metagenome TaxID=1070528 RepID=A0A6C0LFM8_9ZZZZ